MPLPPRSSDGLTVCPACRAHVVAASRPSVTVCPFCGANQHADRARRLAGVGRGGLLAASLVAWSASGCGSPDARDDDTTVSSDDGAGGDDAAGGDGYQDAPDYGPVAEYGVAPEEEDRGARPVPAYGVAPAPR
ncbi:MAG: hypothetical protein KF729_01570 [Sandaracinaceae bacterium]|nr:hypothetical protein [Sandaracinaceae bacterium]